MSSRLEPKHLAEWRERYGRTRQLFIVRTINRAEAGDQLRNLGYRGEALRIELLEWEKDARQTQASEPMTREAMPWRRRGETFEMDWGGYASKYTITVGYYADGRLGEVFINGGKSGEMVEAIARDGAVLLSVALQSGASLAAMAKAVTRDGQGHPSSLIGAVIDRLARDEAPAS